MLKSWMRAVFVYSMDEGKAYQVTDGLSDARYPVFDASGKYLYFTASTNIGPTNSGLDMSAYPLLSTRSVYLAVLKKTDPSPLAPESDEEKVGDAKPDEKPADKPAEGEKKAEAARRARKPEEKAEKPAAKKEPPKVVIDIDGIGQRILALPVSERNIAGPGCRQGQHPLHRRGAAPDQGDAGERPEDPHRSEVRPREAQARQGRSRASAASTCRQTARRCSIASSRTGSSPRRLNR